MRYFALLNLIGVLVCSVSAQEAENGVFLNNTTIYPSNSSSNFSRNVDEWPANNCNGGDCFAILQLVDIPTSDQRSTLLGLGINLHDYVSNRAYLASRNTTQDLDLPDFVEQVLPLEGGNKRPSTPFSLTSGVEGVVDYHLIGLPFPGVSTILLAASLTGRGAVITQHNPFQIRYRVSANFLPSVLDCPLLQYTESVPQAPFAEGNIGRSNLRLNGVNQGPGNGFDGEGIAIAIADDGKVSHLDFYGRLQDHTQYDTGAHGEMTVGMAAGAGNIDQLAKGAAPSATIHLFDIGNDEHITNAVENFNQYGIVITSTSYGEGCGDDYNLATQAIDQQVFENPTLLHCFSAGNHGSDPCFNPYSFLGPNADGAYYGTQTGGRKAGKNVLSIGNNEWNDQILASSSRGPTIDGRIKPDLCALGQADYTTGSQNTYRQSSGTSAAAPIVAGALACLYESYRENHNNTYPSSALIKALALNTADDKGTPGPDFTYGWGRLNAANALRSLEQFQYFESEINHGEQQSFQFPIPSGTERVKIMLYWHDAAGSVLSGRALVNDLDLTIRTPSWDILLPWIPNATPHLDSLALPARPGVDRLNNVEQVVINTPSPGYYNVLVDAHQIPVGAQSYVIVYQIETSQLRINHPQDGSCFSPQEQALISWDAIGNQDDFTIEYSQNGGQSWLLIDDNIDGAQRSYLWTTPSITNTALKIRVSRANQSAISNGVALISPIPVFDIVYASATQAEISWNNIAGASAYAIYVLGEKHMEVKATTANLTYLLPVNTGEEYWVSVAPIFGSKTGRRANARIYQHVACDRYVTLDIQFDQYPSETAWYILDQNGAIVESSGAYTGIDPYTFISLDLCLPEGCYTLAMTDLYNDGICCENGNGYYRLSSINGNVLVEGGDFGGFQYDVFCPEESDNTMPDLIVTTEIIQQPSCYNQQDGAARAIVSGGSGNYVYNWSNGTHGSSVQGLGAGQYQVTVVDGDQNKVQSVLIQNPPPLTIQYNTQNSICNDGSITVNVVGGTPPFSYVWSDNGVGSSRTNLAAAQYFLIVTDANGCTQTTTIEVSNGGSLQANLTANHPNCTTSTDGSLAVVATGGHGNYQFQWSNGQQNTPTISGLGTGIYSITVTSGNCQQVVTQQLVAPVSMLINSNIVEPSCHDSADGYVTIDVVGGVEPYSYHWSNGQTATSISNLTSGIYLLTVTDANGCTEVRGYELDSPEMLQVQVDVAMAQATVGGSVTLNISGGLSPYQIQWEHGPQEPGLSDLSPGMYAVLITDQNGCNISSSIIIEEFDPNANELVYCDMQGASTAYEWIEEIVVNGESYESGNDGGYGEYLESSITLAYGQSQIVDLIPGYSATAYNEHWSIWIDYNHDGDFDEVNESVLNFGPISGANTISFELPTTALLGETRMRVAMQYSQSPTSCNNLNYGEVEDYTVTIVANQNLVQNPTTSGISSFVTEEKFSWTAFPNPVKNWMIVKGTVPEKGNLTIHIYDSKGQIITKEAFGDVDGIFEHAIDMEKYPTGSYFIELRGGNWRELLTVVK